ncbi:MAG: riboflavin synthase subunit alpha [Candidatus Rokubacteria bacterium GWA2_70_23]|nr:MAG: riboflavin synthase subunit alpha [Candidatus Rokubacteria bacterium GWA2_70_23]
MFTGIIEELGRVASRDGSRLAIEAKRVLSGSDIGASVAVNGACLTVVARGAGRLAFDLGPETLAVTALDDLRPGDAVNLERPLALGGFVGGHLVLGHVDGIGLVTDSHRTGESARVRIEWQDESLAPLVIPKGSVAVDGVSLTVAALLDRAFEVMLIPHTLSHTTLGAVKPGSRVNLEADMIGKYVVRSLSLRGGTP